MMNRHLRNVQITNPRPSRCETVALPVTDPFGVADLFKIGIGPSSSHTIGPMKAARMFRQSVIANDCAIVRIRATAHGSLAWTGKGHATDTAIILGLAGERPDDIDPDLAPIILAEIAHARCLDLGDGWRVPFDSVADVVFDFGLPLGRHPNALTFEAFDADGGIRIAEIWYSVGGGFIEREGDFCEAASAAAVPFAYGSARDLLSTANSEGLTIAAIALANECARKSEAESFAFLDTIADAMFDCVARGLDRRGILPGGLNVRRRAADIYARLVSTGRSNVRQPHEAMDYVSAFAMAVNEENAAGGRVVTAPTNGASGVVPAVLRYHRDFCGGDRDDCRTFLLTAAAVGDLIKRNASISGAEVGCQGEVGSASAMAAAGLCAVLGGSPEQTLNAAEIGLEHHLGMTCDPIGGLVQIPCIERNAFGAVKAINAASLALHGDGAHRVSFDQCIETMRQTGLDMNIAYRETSRGGLAINVPEC